MANRTIHLNKTPISESVPFSIIYNGADVTYSPTSGNKTFTSVPFGTASADRVVVIVLHIYMAAGNNISSMTIGGVSAVKQSEATPDGFDRRQIWSAAVPTGTSGDVAITVTGNPNYFGYHSLSIYGADGAAAYDTGGNINGNPSVDATFTGPAGGGGIGYLFIANAERAIDWGDAVEDYHLQVTDTASLAHQLFVGAASGPAMSASWTSGGSSYQSVFASWGPDLPTVTWNPSDIGADIALSNSNLDASKLSAASGWTSVRATSSKSTGKRYFEFHLISWHSAIDIGMAKTGGTLANRMGSLGVDSLGHNNTGTWLSEGSFTDTTGVEPALVNDSIVGVAVDFDAGKIWFAKNNDYTQFKASSNPATGASHRWAFTANTALFPALSMYGNADGNLCVRLKACEGFRYAPPSGFVAWDSLDTDTIAWIDAVVTAGGGVDSSRRILVNDLIVGLKTDGVWSILDRLWLLAGENTQSALIDIVALTTATNVGALTFTADRGYTGAGSPYLDLNFNPTTASSPHFVRDSACVFAWSNTSGAEDSPLVGIPTGGVTRIFPKFTDNNTYWGVNGSGGETSVLGLTAVGLYSANRSGSSAQQLYVNGSSVATGTQASVAPPNEEINGFIESSYASFKQISCIGISGSLDATKQAALYNRLRTYMAAVVLDDATNAWVDAVVTAGGTVSDAQKLYVNELIVGLKTDGLFTLAEGLWLFAGEGVEEQSKIDIVNLNEGTTVGGLVYSDVGIHDGGSANSAFNTGITSGSNYTTNSASLGAVSVSGYIAGEGPDNVFYQFGVTVGADCTLRHDWSSNIFQSYINGTSLHNSSTTPPENSPLQGVFMSSRTSSTAMAAYRNGVQLDTWSDTATGTPTQPLASLARTIGASSYDGFAGPDSNLAAIWIGAGLDATQAAAWNARICAYLAHYHIIPTIVNHIRKSYDLSNAAWSSSAGITVVPNDTVAPDGSTTAALVHPNTSGSYAVYLRQSNQGDAVETDYTVSIYVKPNNWTWIALRMYDGTSNSMTWFNVPGATVGTIGASTTDADIVSVGGGWYRISIASVAVNADPLLDVFFCDGDNTGTCTNSGTNGMWMWGPQVVNGVLPLTYSRSIW